MSPATLASNNGMFVGAFVDSVSAASGLVAGLDTHPYDESFLIWDLMYANDVLNNGPNSTSNPMLYKEYDVRAKRKIANINETLMLTLETQGNVTMGASDNVHIVSSCLLKMPGRG